MEKIIKALQSLILSVKAHPDYDPSGGEFYDLVNIAEKALAPTEDKKAPVIRQESNPNANAIHVKREMEYEQSIEMLKEMLPKQESRTAKEETLTGIKTIMFSAFLQGKDQDGSFHDWYKRNDLNKTFYAILETYSRERVEALEEKIQDLEILLDAAKRGIEQREFKLSTLEETLKACEEVEEVRDKAIQDIQSEVYRRIEIHTGIEVIRKIDFDIALAKLKTP